MKPPRIGLLKEHEVYIKYDLSVNYDLVLCVQRALCGFLLGGQAIDRDLHWVYDFVPMQGTANPRSKMLRSCSSCATPP